MPKNKLKGSDLDELLAKSQRLLSDGYGSSGISTGGLGLNLFRGVAELQEGSKKLSVADESGNSFGRPTGAMNEQHHLEAYRLLSQKNFDAKRLKEEVNSVVIKEPDESQMTLEGADIEGYLAHHHDMIILAAIEEAKRSSENDVSDMQRRWIMQEWSSAKTNFMESLGHRANQWNATHRQDSNYLLTNTPSSKFGDISTPMQATRTPLIVAPDSMTSAGNFSSTPMPLRRNPTTTPTASSHYHFSTMLHGHMEVVRKLNTSIPRGRNAPRESLDSILHPCEELAKIVLAESSTRNSIDGLSPQELSLYHALLTMLSYMTCERNDYFGANPQPSSSAHLTRYGYFAPICFDSGEVDVLEKRKRLLTFGSMSYLEYQMHKMMQDTVEDAIAKEEIIVKDTNDELNQPQTLRAFVGYQNVNGCYPSVCSSVLCQFQQSLLIVGEFATTLLGSREQLEQDEIDRVLRVPLWSYVYYCLRIGELHHAIAELSLSVNAGHSDGESFVLIVLKSLLFLQMKYSNEKSFDIRDTQRRSLSLNQNQFEVNQFMAALNKCRELYDREMKKDATLIDPFRCLVFNLCGLSDREGFATTPSVELTLEDFLWGNLWFIQTLRIIGEVTANRKQLGNTPMSVKKSSGVSRVNSFGEAEMFDMILDFGGKEYFDADRQSSFKYATVLFSCHRFGDAISHLWLSNKTLPAVHLAVLAMHYGLILPHMPLTQNPSHPLVSNRSIGFIADPTPGAIIQIFSNQDIFLPYPEISMDYLISLDCHWYSNMADDVRDVTKLKAESYVFDIFEAFLISLDRNRLKKLFGEPLIHNPESLMIEDNPQPIDKQLLVNDYFATDRMVNSSPNRMASNPSPYPRFRSGGRIDSYMNDHNVESLLCRTAYHLLTERGEPEMSIYFYQLAGKYSEVIEELCHQLSEHFLPPNKSIHRSEDPVYGYNPSTRRSNPSSSPRENWVSLAESFCLTYLKDDSCVAIQALVRKGQRGMVDELITLIRLMQFIDCCLEKDYRTAIDLLDQIDLLPKSPDQVDIYTSVRSQLRPVIDDILVVAMGCYKQLYVQLEGEKMSQSSRVGIYDDKEMQMNALRMRSKAVIVFASRIKSMLKKHDTMSSLSSMDSIMM